jgi:GNAT superfamily N-acetyltransferase
MKIIDLIPEHEELYFQCLEDWSDDIKEAGDHKARWFQRMKDKGLGVKLALDDQGTVGGMIQYVPIEYSSAEGRDLYFVPCIWVHGHKQGRGNFQKKGMGWALLRAAEEDVRGRGAKGLVVWGLSLPFFMRASWFKKQGYSPVDKLGMGVLLWKSFAPDAQPPKWVKPKKRPGPASGQVEVRAFVHGWCPSMNMITERARRASAELGDRVDFQTIDTWPSDVFNEWGIRDGLFINGKEVRTGPPPSYDKIRKKIAKQVKKVKVFRRNHPLRRIR